MVGRTPWSAADARVGLLAPSKDADLVVPAAGRASRADQGVRPTFSSLPYIRQLHPGGDARATGVRESSSR